MTKPLLLIFLLYHIASFSQSKERYLYGTLVDSIQPLKNVHIINLTT